MAAAETDGVLLEIDRVSRRFGGLKAVDDVSLAIRRGEVVALIGPNGAGKTTLFNLLTGQLRPSSGDVRFMGESINRLPVHQRARRGLGRTFQVVHPLRSLTVLENVMVGAFAAQRTRRAAERRAQAVLEDLELSHRYDALAGGLSRPERKRLEMARALAGDPEILLLDEVMAGLRPTETDRMVAIFRKLNAETGLTILLIEHVMRAVMALSRHIVVVNYGKVIAEGAPEAVTRDPDVLACYLGEEAL
jgi:branched-chain amino acid transport system ATP-binding protein